MPFRVFAVHVLEPNHSKGGTKFIRRARVIALSPTSVRDFRSGKSLEGDRVAAVIGANTRSDSV